MKFKQDMFRGFKMAGFTMGAIGASVILQTFLMHPAFSDASQEHCKQLTPPGPGQISFCVEEKEEAELQKEINDCGGDVRKFMTRMNYHAAGSKRAYSDAVKDIHPVIANAISHACASKEHEPLPIRTFCYQQTLELMEKDANDLEEMYVTSGLDTPEVLEGQLIKADHFLGKILFQQCGETPSKNCFYYNLVAIHEQLTNAYNEMSGAFDDMSRWAIMAAACDSKLGSDACHRAREWKNTDFVQAKVTAKDYAPTYKLPGPTKSFNPPVRVENTDKFRTYHSHRKFTRKRKVTKKGKVTNSASTGSSNGSAKKGGSGGDANGNGYGKGAGVGSGTGNNTVINTGKTAAAKPAAPKNHLATGTVVVVVNKPAAPGTTPIVPGTPGSKPATVPIPGIPAPQPSSAPAPSVTPEVKPAATPQPGIIPSPDATAAAPVPATPAPAASAAPTPLQTDSIPLPVPTESGSPTGSPSGTPNGSKTGTPGGLGTHNDDGKPHEELKCDDASKDDYIRAARLPFDLNSGAALNLPAKLSGQQALYACTVKASFADSRPALVLAKHGMSVAKLTPELMKGVMLGNFTSACPKMKIEFTDLQADLQSLQQTDPSTELDALTADLVDFNGRDCADINSILKNQMKPNTVDPVIGKLEADYCAWKKTVDVARPGSTAGMSIYLAPCRN